MSDSWEVWGCILDKYFFCVCIILNLKYRMCAYSIHAYTNFAYMPAKSLQLCATLCDSMDCSPPGSSVHGILQAKYRSGLPRSPPGDVPEPGIKPRSPALAGGFQLFTTGVAWEAQS